MRRVEVFERTYIYIYTHDTLAQTLKQREVAHKRPIRAREREREREKGPLFGNEETFETLGKSNCLRISFPSSSSRRFLRGRDDDEDENTKNNDA